MPSFAELTTLGVGGEIERFELADSLEGLRAFYGDLDRQEAFVLGGGSNLLVADEPFLTPVVQPGLMGLELELASDCLKIRVGSGLGWDKLVLALTTADAAAIAPLSGIPGRVGGAVVQNIGAYGAEASEFVRRVSVYDPAADAALILTRDDLDYGYRSSVLKSSANQLVVVSVELEVRLGKTRPRYPQLQERLGSGPVDAWRLRQEVLKLRAAKGMLTAELMPPGYSRDNSVSAGSFFKNPTLVFSDLKYLPPDLPSWPLSEDPTGQVRVSAAWLIERAGFFPGFSLPGSGAALSTQHVLAIVNRRRARADQIHELAGLIQLSVENRFGISLEPEPVILGF